MNKGLKSGLFALALVALAACGSDDSTDSAEEGARGIDTGDVKGEIDLMGAEGGELSYGVSGNRYKAYKVEINENAEMIIFPTDKSFEEEKGAIERRVASSSYDVEIISAKDGCIFFKETKENFSRDKKR